MKQTTTFKEIGDAILKDKNHPMYEEVKAGMKIAEKRRAEKCELCGKTLVEHDGRGFIYFHNIDKKAGWECVEKIIMEKLNENMRNM